MPRLSRISVVSVNPGGPLGGQALIETIGYRFSEMKFFSAPNAPGTQMKASLQYTHNGCEVNYDVYAVWPTTDCDPEAFAHPTEGNKKDRCDFGSGLNPEFDAICVPDANDATTGKCVINRFPAFKPED